MEVEKDRALLYGQIFKVLSSNPSNENIYLAKQLYIDLINPEFKFGRADMESESYLDILNVFKMENNTSNSERVFIDWINFKHLELSKSEKDFLTDLYFCRGKLNSNNVNPVIDSLKKRGYIEVKGKWTGLYSYKVTTTALADSLFK